MRSARSIRRRRGPHTHFSTAAPAPLLAAGAIAGLAACGAPGTESPAPAALSYTLPESNPVVYRFSDSARFSIDAGPMGMMNVGGSQEGRAELTFRETEDGLAVEVRFPRLEATFSNPSQGAERADQSDLEGAIGVRLSERGRVAVVDTPAMTQALAEMVGPETLVRPLFVHLPGRPVEAGGSWVDTVRTTEETGGTRSTGLSIVTTTMVGDTLVDGRRLLLLRTRSESTVEVSGQSGGVDIEQRLSGTTLGHALWDPASGVLVEREEEGELAGVLNLPGVDMGGLPVTGSVRRTVALEP